MRRFLLHLASFTARTVAAGMLPILLAACSTTVHLAPDLAGATSTDCKVFGHVTYSGNSEYLPAVLVEAADRPADAVLRYDGSLAPLVYAGSDVFLMPSLFEPCGLGQLIAMRYGSVPVARATGGLADTVRDGVTGFTFSDYDVSDFWEALRRALYIWHHDHGSWRAMQLAGMAMDSSWLTSARSYQQLYEWGMASAR